MSAKELFQWLGKRAADYHQSYILPPKRQSSQKKTVKIQHGKPSPTPDVDGKTAVQPAQRYGTKVSSGNATGAD